MKKNKIMKPLIVIAILFIPLMYSFFYLKAFWDPYGNLKTLPVGIVNLDEGNENENLGNELVQKIKDKDVMKFDVLNEDEANDLLADEKYYALITIPKNFTKELNNAESSDRQVATITYSPNQKSNYLASQIINKVVTSVQKELTGEINDKIVSTLSDKLNEVPTQIGKISDGAGELKDGTDKLSSGLQEISNGTSTLNSNYKKFDTGITSATQGSTSLQNGLNQLSSGVTAVQQGTQKLEDNTKNLNELTSKVSTMASSSNQLNSGISNYVDTVNSTLGTISATQSNLTQNITANVSDIQKNLQLYIQNNPEAANSEYIQKISKDLYAFSKMSSSSDASKLEKLVTSGNTLKQKNSQLNEGIQTLANKTSSLSQLSEGAAQINSGVKQLQAGVNQVQSGGKSLNSGLTTLSNNSKKIQSGISTLNSGAQSALNGSTTLSDGVSTLKTEVDNKMSDTKEQLNDLNGLNEYANSPVEVEEQDYGQINSYGLGFAPYFISISLWVGNLISYVVFYYDPEDRFKLLGQNAKNKHLRSLLYVLIAIAQAIVLGFILKLGLGFTVTNTLLYYGTCILTSVVFLSIIQFLIINFGDVGKFFSILFLVLQLAASGGTFPIETVPQGFQAISKFMPMTYTIKLLKESLVLLNNSSMVHNLLIIVGILLFFLIETIIFSTLRDKYKAKKQSQE